MRARARRGQLDRCFLPAPKREETSSHVPVVLIKYCKIVAAHWFCCHIEFYAPLTILMTTSFSSMVRGSKTISLSCKRVLALEVSSVGGAERTRTIHYHKFRHLRVYKKRVHMICPKPQTGPHPGTIHKRVVSEFGTTVLDSDGVIDREKLGKVIFSDPAKRRKLDKVPSLCAFASTAAWACLFRGYARTDLDDHCETDPVAHATRPKMWGGGGSRKACLVRHPEVTVPSSWTYRCSSSSRSCAAFASLQSLWCWCCLGVQNRYVFGQVALPMQSIRMCMQLAAWGSCRNQCGGRDPGSEV